MIPKSLSASAAASFEGCEARYKAEYIDRTPDQSKAAASRGSAVHAALQMWVEQGFHKHEWPDIMAREKAMHVVWDSVYYDFFPDKAQYAEGWKMLNRWLQRTDWTGREVLSTEVKESFNIPSSIGPIPFNYIWDRADIITDTGDIEVIDYKSVIVPVQPDELKHKIQPRAYAVSAAIKYPHATRIWITYDLLRYDTVSKSFNREDNIETWKYLKRLLERIIASDGTKETLNAECRWCVRRFECETVKKNAQGAGIMRYATKEELADKRADLEMALGAMKSSLEEIDDALFAAMENDEVFDFTTTKVDVRITAQSRRHVESERVAQILGPELMAKYGNVGVGDLDKIMEIEELTPSQLSQLKQSIRKQTGTPRIKTTLKTAFEED
jgi:hypothetical protein